MHPCLVLALVVVPIISVGVRKFGRYLKELSHATQAAAAVAASIAEVLSVVYIFYFTNSLQAHHMKSLNFDSRNPLGPFGQ